MEPSSGSITGLTITVGTVSIAGTLFGMHYDSLMFGLFGGLIFLSRTPAGTRMKAVTGVISSCLVAGALSPILATFVSSLSASLAKVDPDTMRRAASLVVGGSWQVAAPEALKAVKDWFTRGKNAN